MIRFGLATVLIGCAASPSEPQTSATGELADWLAQAKLPVARANHCSAASADRIYVIGGNRKEGSGFVKTKDIHSAIIDENGAIATWQVAGQLPSAATECTATVIGSTLYVVGGLYDDPSHQGKI